MKGSLGKCLANLATNQSIYPEQYLCIIKDTEEKEYEILPMHEVIRDIKLVSTAERRIVLHATLEELKKIFKGVQLNMLDEVETDD